MIDMMMVEKCEKFPCPCCGVKIVDAIEQRHVIGESRGKIWVICPKQKFRRVSR